MMMKSLVVAGVVAGMVVSVVAGCGKESAEESRNAPAATATKIPGGWSAATAAGARTTTATKAAETHAVISKDEPVAFETPEGKGFKIKKNGLAYREDKEGEGKPPELGNTVEVKFTLMHLDKKEILSNQKDPKSAPYRFAFGSKEPLAFWNEAVATMKRGGKRRVILPPALAFGEKGFADESGKRLVAPNETLLLDVELANIIGEPPTPGAEEVSGPPKYSTTAPANLKIEVLQEGKGEGAVVGKRLAVKYLGKLTDGTVFDQGTYNVTLGHTDVIKGWHMGLAGIKVGEKRRITIPPELGYGEKGSPPKIPGNATLVFEVELAEMK